MTREEFTHELNQLRERVVTLESMVDKAIRRSTDALFHEQVALAREVIKGDAAINDYRWDTEDETFKVIAMQGPIASDLRTCLSVISIVTDLERMGDHAVSIARTAIDIADDSAPRRFSNLPDMSRVALEMLAASLDAFIRGDVDRALDVIKRDDEVDALFKEAAREFVQEMVTNPDLADRYTKLIWVGHNLERIGDRVTNICERVVYSVKGVLDLQALTAHKEDYAFESGR